MWGQENQNKYFATINAILIEILFIVLNSGTQKIFWGFHKAGVEAPILR